jgi:prevent-host-death family protein
LAELQRDKEPILITQHGLPSAYLIDVESFERLQFRMNVLEGIARGERAVEEGRTLTHDEAKAELSRWLK